MKNAQPGQSGSFAIPVPLQVRKIPARLATALSCLTWLALTSCGGSFKTLSVNPDFSFFASPASLSLIPGGPSQSISVSVVAVNRFQQPVTVTVSGLPSGITASPSSVTLTPGSAQMVTLTASPTAAPGILTISLTASAGGVSHSTTITATIAAASTTPDFSLFASPTSLNLTAGAAASHFSVLAAAVNSFSGPVKVAFSGLPPGVTASPASLTLTPGAAQNVAFTAASTAAASTSTITLTGTSGTLTHSVTIHLAVAPAPDFSLFASPTSLNLTAGGAASHFSVLVTALNSFTGNVNAAFSGLPSGVTASPASLTLTPGKAQNVAFTAASAAAAGTAHITLTATSGTLTHSTTVTATIANAAPAPDFSLTASPTSLNLTAGATGSPVSVLATALNSFTGTVKVAFSGLPSGVTASPTSLNLAPGTAQNVTFTAASTAAAGASTITLTSTSGTLTHSTTIHLAVSSAPDFSLSASPTTLSLTPGATGSLVSVLATALNSFTGTVKVAFSGLPAGVTASPTSLTLAPGTAQSVTVSAASTAAAGAATITLTATSGTLTHSATLHLTVAVTPDFSLTPSPTSLALTAGQTGATVQVTAAALNSFSGAVKVAFSGLPAGVTASPTSLTLTPGAAQNVTFTAASTAAAGTSTITLTATSGTLTHAATIHLTVAAAPNFSLSASPTSLTLTAGATGSPVSVLATALNSFTGTVKVAFSGLPSGVTTSPTSLTLTAGTAQSVTFTAASTAAPGASTITLTATSGSLTHTATLALTVQPAVNATGVDVTTYHYDNARDGLNAHETTLTLANVNSTQFGKIGFDTVDGKVDAQPLYISNIAAGGLTRNVLYIATEHDSVYAFDADTGVQIWKTSILGAGETTSDTRNCDQITPEIGITSTPVIDRKQGAHGTLFTVGMTKDSSGNYHQRLHAFDLATGAEITGSPTEITGSYPGTGDNTSNGSVVFAPGQYAERAALLLLNGNIYTTWTSHCDFAPYTGWIIAYSESTLKQSKLLNITPNGSEGSVWMSGNGPAADASGNIYFLDANGTFDTTFNANGFPAKGDYGNAILKLSTSPTLAVADYFEPYNTSNETTNDVDLGSGGEILLPDQTDSGGTVRHLLVGAGKDSIIYIADRDNMGKFVNGATSNSYIYQAVSGVLGNEVFSTPAFFNGTLYYGAKGDTLRAIPMTAAKLALHSSSTSANAFPYPGTTPSVSANGTQNGIVWALESSTSAAAVLHAFDAANLSHELYTSTQAPASRDTFGNGNKFITPLIVNGKVYVGTQTGVAIFGLLTP